LADPQVVPLGRTPLVPLARSHVVPLARTRVVPDARTQRSRLGEPRVVLIPRPSTVAPAGRVGRQPVVHSCARTSAFDGRTWQRIRQEMGQAQASPGQRRRLPIGRHDQDADRATFECRHPRCRKATLRPGGPARAGLPGGRFTLDGHLVGSIGEVLAAEKYGLTLLSMITAKHDAKANDGRLVQLKTTQGRSVGLRSEPDYLLVLKLSADGRIDEVYNGPGAPAWAAAGKRQKNGQHSIGVAKLSVLTASVPKADRILSRID